MSATTGQQRDADDDQRQPNRSTDRRRHRPHRASIIAAFRRQLRHVLPRHALFLRNKTPKIKIPNVLKWCRPAYPPLLPCSRVPYASQTRIRVRIHRRRGLSGVLMLSVQSSAFMIAMQLEQSSDKPLPSPRTTARWLSVDVMAFLLSPLRPRRSGSLWWKCNARSSAKPQRWHCPPFSAMALALVRAR